MKRAEPVRGDWVIDPAAHAPTDRLDVRLQVLASEARPLSERAVLQLHLGAAAVNAQMVVEIARVYGISLSRKSAQDLALSVGRTMAGLGLVKGGVGLLATALSLNVPALVVSRALQAVSAAWLTRIAGLSFITYFERDQEWGDGGLQEVVQQQYDLNRREGALSRFLEAAFNRVVQPLQAKQPSLAPRPPSE